MTLRNLKVKNSVLKPKTSKFTKKILSIIEYYSKWYKKIDCNPIGQRPPVPDKNNSKKEGIIRSILLGINLGEITIVKNYISKTLKYMYESLDGGHRKRYIWQFMNNEFSVDGIYFNKLSSSRKKAFEKYKLTFVIYEPMSNHAKGYIFRTVNDSTHINHQEMLNSYGDTNIACAMRETVRQIQKSNGQYTTTNHPIFETTNSSFNYKYLDFDNERLFTEELITHIAFRYTQKSLLGGTSDENTEKMYKDLENSKKEVGILSKKLTNHLNILFEFSKVKKSIFNCGLSQKEWKLLSYLIFYLIDEFKKFKIKNYQNFYKSFKECLNLMTDDGGSLSKKTNINYKKDLYDLDFDSKNRTIGEAFKQYLNVVDNCNKIKQAVVWYLNEFDILEHIDILDKNRSYVVKIKHSQLASQKYICFIDDEPLTYAEAEAAHIKPHSKGGRTDKDNIVMVRKIHNRNMGTMNAIEYKEFYTKNKNKKINSDNNYLTKNLTVDTSPNMAANGHTTL